MSDASNTVDLTLPLDAFIRSVGVNQTASHAFLIGAGASTSSGIQSAYMCTWEWKRKIFLTNNPGLESQFQDLSLTSTQQRIQRWLDGEGKYVPLDAPEEYGFYAEQCYPNPKDRRRYFQELVETARPYIGYQLLCLLASAGIVKSVWTPNFDNLTPKAAVLAGVTVIDIGLDSTQRTSRQAHTGELVHVAVHGDYRYDSLRNTPDELKAQDEKLSGTFKKHLLDASLIVSGYSGRDESLMATLMEAYSQPGQGRLYWCGYEAPLPDEKVASLIRLARQQGRDAYYIATSGFDETLIRLSLYCLKGEALKKAQELRGDALSRSSKQSPSFMLDVPRVTSIIRSNAFEVECPSEVLQFTAKDLRRPKTWDHIDELVAGRDVVAVPQKGKILALGTIDAIKAAFKERLIGEIERTPITDDDLRFPKGIIVSLLTKALVRSMAQAAGLGTDNRNLMWLRQPYRDVTAYGQRYNCHEGVLVRLRLYGGKTYLVLKPTVRGKTLRGEDVPLETDKEIRRQVLTKQYNEQFNTAINHWRNLLFASGGLFEFPPNCGSTFRYTVQKVPALAKINALQQATPINITPTLQRHIAYSGVQFPEPNLVFSNTNGDGFVTDPHPIRGTVQNQPYDFALTRRGLGKKEIQVGVVCPVGDSRRLSAYLNALHLSKKPESKDEYLLDYPGFSSAFGMPLQIPQPENNGWVNCSDPVVAGTLQEGANKLSRQITQAITSLVTSSSPSVIIIYIPERWRVWDHYNAEDESFNLHDYIKAFCVQQGIATQLIREATLEKPYQCEVYWWLALSLYTKGMHTPWVLESLDPDTAFMGFGYSVDSRAARGQHIVLGCSHIYSAEGVGLRYKLRKIENFALRQGNPYMSREDARRAGDGARQLFFDSLERFPKRVVVHKRTPFDDEERDGLIEGLAGIETLDLVEINIDDELRFVASMLQSDGKFKGDAYPVRRGTTVVLDERKALIWVHGSADSINPRKRTYYQGKSRIPAPLVITRHYGSSSLSVLAKEILGLSKMNWNTFDMYTKVPATIQSSNEIARIGVLLERFGERSYDYRLFI